MSTGFFGFAENGGCKVYIKIDRSFSFLKWKMSSILQRASSWPQDSPTQTSISPKKMSQQKYSRQNNSPWGKWYIFRSIKGRNLKQNDISKDASSLPSNIPPKAHISNNISTKISLPKICWRSLKSAVLICNIRIHDWYILVHTSIFLSVPPYCKKGD